MNDNKNAVNTKFFRCDKCNFTSCKKSLYTKHLSTRKHEILTNTDIYSLKKSTYNCKCGKEYKHRQSLCSHKKKCNYKEKNNKSIEEDDKIINNNENTELKELIMKLLVDNADMKKENQKLINHIVEIVPKVGNNNNNNVKNKFNINVFLNEKCKDALSMDQFIDKIEVTMKNLLTTKDRGLGQGLSNIIIDNMNKLSLYERPMHCTDKKRETLYVKNNEWEKDEKKEQIGKLLNRVEEKQMKNIEKWTKKHPNYQTDDNLQKEYMDLVKSCTTPIEECGEKTIKNVCDLLYIEKEYI